MAHLSTESAKLANGTTSVPLAVIRSARRRKDGKVYINDDKPARADYKPRGEIEIVDGVMSPLPNHQTRVWYVFAAAGAGKSSWVGNLLSEVRADKGGDVPMFLISRAAEEDEAFEGLDLQRIVIDDDYMADPLRYNDFPAGGCWVVIDDFDTFPKDQKAVVIELIEDLCNSGRKHGINVIVTSHLGANNSETKAILNSMQNVTIFPAGSSAHQIKYVLGHYCGCSNDDIRKMLKLPTRWVSVRRVYPPCVTWQGGCYMLGAAAPN